MRLTPLSLLWSCISASTLAIVVLAWLYGRDASAVIGFAQQRSRQESNLKYSKPLFMFFNKYTAR